MVLPNHLTSCFDLKVNLNKEWSPSAGIMIILSFDILKFDQRNVCYWVKRQTPAFWQFVYGMPWICRNWTLHKYIFIWSLQRNFPATWTFHFFFYGGQIIDVHIPIFIVLTVFCRSRASFLAGWPWPTRRDRNLSSRGSRRTEICQSKRWPASTIPGIVHCLILIFSFKKKTQKRKTLIFSDTSN